MASLESLPPDQRAVLQLVLQRGRSYDEIARLLSIDRSAVRQRACLALTALGPQTGLADDRRRLITDYLLGQLNTEGALGARDGIAAAPGERAWARVVGSELAPLASGPLPEIPTAPAAAGAPVSPPTPSGPIVSEPPAPTPVAAAAPPTQAASAPAAPAADPTQPRRRPRLSPGRRAGAGAGPTVPAGDDGGRRSSRLGGAVLIGLTVIIVAAVAVILLNQNSGNDAPAASHTATGIPATTPPTASATTTGSTSSAAKVVAQINLTPTAAGGKAAGIAEVLRQGTANGIAIVGQNVAPNTTKPPNAYAVWLYNSPADAHILGFVNPGVAANGRLSTAGGLPANASHYKQLIITLENKASPKTPGAIVLAGALPAGL